MKHKFNIFTGLYRIVIWIFINSWWSIRNIVLYAWWGIIDCFKKDKNEAAKISD